jgi:tetratricopeptide (TPR) repeat protein
VESVGWVSGTKDLLCGLLSSSALLMYVRSVQVRSQINKHRWDYRWRYLVGTVFFILAMLAKPTAVVVPLMAGVISIFFLNRSLTKTLVSLLPWFLLMLPFLYWTQKYQPASWADPLPIWARPAVALDALAFYFYKLLWPIHLTIDYGHNPKTIAANHEIYFTWILPVVAIGLLYWRYPRSRPVAAAGLLFLMPLLPILGFVPFEFQLTSTTADHYLYLPMLGIAVLLAWTITRYPIPMGMVLVVLLALAVRTVLQEPVWQDSQSLFRHALEVNPNSIQARDNLGFLAGREARRFETAGNKLAARQYFDQSIYWYRQSVTRDPTNVPSMYNLALDYQRIGRIDLGREQIRRMVQVQDELSPDLKADPLHLASLLLQFDDAPSAIALLDRVLTRDPSNLGSMQMRAIVERKLRQSSTRPH